MSSTRCAPPWIARGSPCYTGGAGSQRDAWRAQDCAAQLQSIYDNYYGPPAGTICQTAIQTALTEADPALCPPSNVTVPCFNVRNFAAHTTCTFENVLCSHSSCRKCQAQRHARVSRMLSVAGDGHGPGLQTLTMVTDNITCVVAASADAVDGFRDHLRRVLLVRLQPRPRRVSGDCPRNRQQHQQQQQRRHYQRPQHRQQR